MIEERPFAALNDLVYEYILDEINEMRIRPGEKINTKMVSEELSISRTPVRNALERLAEERLVERSEGKGYKLCEVDWADCLALYDVRQMLEVSSAKMAANRISREHMRALVDSISMLEKAKSEGDTMLSFDADNLFHETIVLSTRNDYLISMRKKIKKPLRRYQMALFLSGKYDIRRDTHIVTKHKVIFNAIKQGYSQVAMQEMKDHLDYIDRILFDGGLIGRGLAR